MKKENISNLKIFEKHGSKYLADVDTEFEEKADKVFERVFYGRR